MLIVLVFVFMEKIGLTDTFLIGGVVSGTIGFLAITVKKIYHNEAFSELRIYADIKKDMLRSAMLAIDYSEKKDGVYFPKKGIFSIFHCCKPEVITHIVQNGIHTFTGPHNRLLKLSNIILREAPNWATRIRNISQLYARNFLDRLTSDDTARTWAPTVSYFKKTSKPCRHGNAPQLSHAKYAHLFLPCVVYWSFMKYLSSFAIKRCPKYCRHLYSISYILRDGSLARVSSYNGMDRVDLDFDRAHSISFKKNQRLWASTSYQSISLYPIHCHYSANVHKICNYLSLKALNQITL